MSGGQQARVSVNLELNCVRVWEGGRNARQTYFTAKHYNSLENAYQAAVAYEATLDIPRHYHPQKNPSINSQSRIVGVCPFNKRSGEQGGWRANWTEKQDGKIHPKTKDFSFFTHGPFAKEKAIAYREAMVEKRRSTSGDGGLH